MAGVGLQDLAAWGGRLPIYVPIASVLGMQAAAADRHTWRPPDSYCWDTGSGGSALAGLLLEV